MIKAGSRWKSVVCDTEAMLVKPASNGAAPECGGVAMIAATEPKPSGTTIRPGFDTGSLLGKRYADAATGMEMLCIKPGKGALGVEGRALAVRDAKALPASD